jgi:hypothetical protein
MKRVVAVSTVLTFALLLLLLSGTALAAPRQSLQVNGSGTVPLVNDNLPDSPVTGTATITIHAKSMGEPVLATENDDRGNAHYYLTAPAKGSVTIEVDDPEFSVSFTAKVTTLRTPWMDQVPFGLLDVVFDDTDLPPGVNPGKNLIYISDMAGSGYPDHVWLWFVGEYLGSAPNYGYSPADLERGNFIVRGWTWPEPWLPLP